MRGDLDAMGDLFRAQVRSSDPSDRATAAAALENRWLTRRRILPLFYVETSVQVSPRVGGERAALGGLLDLRDAYAWGLNP
jgi:hypothetical protein